MLVNIYEFTETAKNLYLTWYAFNDGISTLPSTGSNVAVYVIIIGGVFLLTIAYLGLKRKNRKQNTIFLKRNQHILISFFISINFLI